MKFLSLVLEGKIPDEFAEVLDNEGVNQVGKEFIWVPYKGRNYPLLLIRADIKEYAREKKNGKKERKWKERKGGRKRGKSKNKEKGRKVKKKRKKEREEEIKGKRKKRRRRRRKRR